MILVDANLLLYARHSRMPQHRQAKAWLDERLNGTVPVGLPWQSLLAFIRISINRRAFPDALTPNSAWQQVKDWLGCEPVWIPSPTEQHADLLGEMISRHSVTSNLVSDVHLAALAIEHGLTLCSADVDFARFSQLRWANPLTPSV